MNTPSDVPRIVVFPPLVPLTTVIVSGMLEWLCPLGFFDRLGVTPRIAIGFVLLLAGIALVASGRRTLIRNGTNVAPTQPTLKLVTDGVYAWTRNPLYLGGSFGMFGLAFLFELDWLPVLYILSFAILHFGIVLPEEAYLEGKFGDQYRRYKADAPRYFGPF